MSKIFCRKTVGGDFSLFRVQVACGTTEDELTNQRCLKWANCPIGPHYDRYHSTSAINIKPKEYLDSTFAKLFKNISESGEFIISFIGHTYTSPCRFTFAVFVLSHEAVRLTITDGWFGYAGEIWGTRLSAGTIWNRQVKGKCRGGVRVGGGEISVINCLTAGTQPYVLIFSPMALWR